MKVLGMTGGILAFALLCGMVIGVALSFGSIPKPVEVPVQVITPVPTPEPVIITEHSTPAPAPAQQQGGQSNPWNATNEDLQRRFKEMFNALSLLAILLAILPIIWAITFFLGLFDKGDDGY
jgi:hypothetical protein